MPSEEWVCDDAFLNGARWAIKRISDLERQVAGLRAALSQIKSMTDDCEQMSRKAADIFDTHIDMALAEFGGADNAK